MIHSLLFTTTATLVNEGDVHSLNLPRIIFLAFAAMAVLGAISTIMRKNDVAAVMSLVATFFALAGVYTFLSAPFLAVLQVLVYAGAIMVLFIFVVMVLNRDESEPWVWRGIGGKTLLGAVPIVLVTLALCTYFVRLPVQYPPTPAEDFGTVAQIGQLIFSNYLFAFEAVSVLLLIAVIAAVVVARSVKSDERDRQHVEGPSPLPEHRFGEAQLGTPYAAHAVPTPPGSGGGPH